MRKGLGLGLGGGLGGHYPATGQWLRTIIAGGSQECRKGGNRDRGKGREEEEEVGGLEMATGQRSC